MDNPKHEPARIELTNCTGTLMHEIATGATRVSVAQTYAFALRSSERTDWATVNAAIMSRWSMSGLSWIKRMAWSGKCFDDANRRPPVRPEGK